MKKIFLWLLKTGFFILAVSLLPWIFIKAFASNKISSPADVAQKSVAIVFGAGLYRDGTPTTVLRERIETAALLYHDGKTDYLLMSGDNRYVEYDEPNAMKDYAIGLGVPSEAIVLDFAGRTTYETCYRARDIFKVEEAILVTQEFHLPRALFICQALGVDAVGASADHMPYLVRTRAWGTIREIPATIKAMWMLYVTKPLPVLGEEIPIMITSEVP